MFPKSRLLILPLLTLLLIASEAYAHSDESEEKWVGDVHLLVGQRNLEFDFWRPVEAQEMIALDIFFGREHWPFRLLVGFSYSLLTRKCDSGNCTGELRDFSMGVATNFRYENITPYLGVGASLFSAVRIEEGVASGKVVDSDDFKVGAFIVGGVAYNFMENYSVGVDVKYQKGNGIDLFDVEGTADFQQVSIALGWSF